MTAELPYGGVPARIGNLALIPSTISPRLLSARAGTRYFVSYHWPQWPINPVG